MTHWSFKYLGQPWSLDCDCFGWFRIIQEQEFGRKFEDINRGDMDRTLFAATNLTESNARKHRWIKTDKPKEGDAVFMAKGTRPHHLGVVALVDNKIHVVHAPEFRGIMINDLLSLRLNQWKIISYWTPEYAN